MNDNEYPYGQDPTRYPYGQNPGGGQYPYGQNRGNGSYPYGGGGQTPYGGGQSPYGGGQSPYGGGPYGYAPRPPKKPLGQRVREAFADPSRRTLMLLGMAAGTGVLLYLLLSDGFTLILTSNKGLYQRYQEDETFSLLLETMYTIFCMALPFSLIFGLMNRLKVTKTELPFGRPRGGWQTALLIPAGLGLCYVGNILSSYLVSFASSFGISFRSYEYALQQQSDMPDTPLLILLTIVHTALLPALMEELVFRGFIMQPLRRYGDWFAIITSAVIFGLVHGNMTQAPFAIIAGLALGYVSVVTGSMWMNILLHFLNNLISVLYSLALTNASETLTVILSIAMTGSVIAIGVIAFVGYAINNRNFARLRPGLTPVRRKAAHYWLMPTMVIALVLLFRQILLDVVVK